MSKIVEKEITHGAKTTDTVTTTRPDILKKRVLLLFVVGMLVSLFFYLVDHFLFRRHSGIESSSWFSYYDWLFLAHPVSFFLGVVLVLVFKYSVRTLQIVDFFVIAFNVALVAFADAVFTPDYQAMFPIALMIFSQAALIPARIWVQVLLGFCVILSAPLSEIWAYHYVQEIVQFWNANGGESVFWGAIASYTIDASVLAALSVLITWILYNYRRDLSKAQRMGKYLIKGEIGKGGMGTVYEASHSFLRRPTAIKVMMPAEHDPETAVARFEQEVKLASSLTHPNTITIFDYGHCAGYTFYYAMELLEGMNLEKFVQKFGPLDANRAIYILEQVCGALAEAHNRGIIHRDIKPSNIFLTERGGLYDFVKVLDFGLAKDIRGTGGADITKAGVLLGTPRYIAPESVHSQGKADGRTDIYMLGSVAYWILTGQPPFAGSSSVDLIVDHVKNTPKKPSEISELPIPDALDDVVMKCLEKDPNDRFQTPLKLSEALEQIMLGKKWDQKQAKEWWELHLPKEETVPVLKPVLDISPEYEPVKQNITAKAV